MALCNNINGVLCEIVIKQDTVNMEMFMWGLFWHFMIAKIALTWKQATQKPLASHSTQQFYEFIYSKLHL